MADYGDPWGLRLSSGRWKPSLSFRVEKHLLRLSTGVVVTTEPTRQLFARVYGLPNEQLWVIPAGVRRLEMGPPPPAHPPTIVQAGTVYGARASVLPFAAALESYRRDRGQAVRLTWFGEIWRTAERERVRQVADEYLDRVPLDAVSQAERKAHIILLLGNHGGTQVPAKVWRALGTGRILLVICADGHDALRTLPALEGRAVFCSNDVPSIVRALELCVEHIRTWDWSHPARFPDLDSWDARAASLEQAILHAIRCRSTHPLHRRILPAHGWTRMLTASGVQLGAAASRRLQSSEEATPQP